MPQCFLICPGNFPRGKSHVRERNKGKNEEPTMHTANRSPSGLTRHSSIPIVTRLATLTALSTLTRLLALTSFHLAPTIISL
jgi:hypothetical protein